MKTPVECRRFCPRLLLVEDDSVLRSKTEYLLEHPVQSRNLRAEVAFSVTSASSFMTAESLLRNSTDAFDGFDVTLLDLEIPYNDVGASHVDHGMSLLEELNNKYRSCCGSVVILSGHAYPSVLIDVIQRGACDFIPKTATSEDMYLRCLKAVEIAKVRRQLEWQQYCRTRQRWEFEQARREGLDEIRRVCSEGVRTCLGESDHLREAIGDRFGVAREYDASDSIATGFSRLNSRLRDISHKLQDTPMASPLGEASSTTTSEEQVDLRTIVTEKLELVRNGISLKRLQVVRNIDATPTVPCIREDLGDVVEHGMVSVIETAAPNSELAISLSNVDGACELTIQSSRDRGLDQAEVSHRDRILRYVRQVAANFGARVEERGDANAFALVISVPV